MKTKLGLDELRAAATELGMRVSRKSDGRPAIDDGEDVAAIMEALDRGPPCRLGAMLRTLRGKDRPSY
jgi:hypothetical protein